ncbi:hypothetical protein GG681_02440 [Epibacterium sp. SM1969]|uniref:Yip1 domain-containing protein n=1 Tax=Tritonibacter aquimaris TaxID=2663379 RepID=A0A844AWB1_9RHOB|nr:YIP1 family protein [Tritonibacter aquimaris]MQY41486.1 hypothetical protein [Tritonibacter aquimaris]
MKPWGDLIWKTVLNPAEAAAEISAIQPNREVLWTGFALVQVLGTALFALQSLLFPQQMQFLTVNVTPVNHLVANTLIILVFACAATICGRFLNGIGTFSTVLACLTWVNFVQVFALAALIVVSLVSPALSGTLGIGVSLYALFVSLHFINAAHKLGSLWRALGVMVLSALAIIVAISIFGQSFMPNTLG